MKIKRKSFIVFPCEDEEAAGKIQFNKLEKSSVELEPAKGEGANYYFLKAVGAIQNM